MLKPQIRRPAWLSTLRAWRLITAEPGWEIVGTKPKHPQGASYMAFMESPEFPGKPSKDDLRRLRREFSQVEIAAPISSERWDQAESLLWRLWNLSPRLANEVSIDHTLRSIKLYFYEPERLNRVWLVVRLNAEGITWENRPPGPHSLSELEQLFVKKAETC